MFYSLLIAGVTGWNEPMPFDRLQSRIRRHCGVPLTDAVNVCLGTYKHTATENGHDSSIVSPLWPLSASELQVQKCTMRTSHCNFSSKTMINGHHWIFRLTWLNDQETQKHRKASLLDNCLLLLFPVMFGGFFAPPEVAVFRPLKGIPLWADDTSERKKESAADKQQHESIYRHNR